MMVMCRWCCCFVFSSIFNIYSEYFDIKEPGDLAAGEDRVIEQPGLTALQSLFHRLEKFHFSLYTFTFHFPFSLTYSLFTFADTAQTEYCIYSTCNYESHMGRSPQSCTETDFEMKTSNFVLFLLISVVSVHFRAIYDETIRCQA